MAKQKLVESFAKDWNDNKLMIEPIKLTETNNKVLVEGKEKSVIAGYKVPVWRVDKKNLNERTYGKKLAEKVVKENKVTFALKDHPDNEGSVDDIVAVGKNPSIEKIKGDNILFAECYFVDDAFERKVEKCIQLNAGMGLSSSAFGELDDDGNVLEESFDLERYFDFVMDPSYEVYLTKENKMQEFNEIKENGMSPDDDEDFRFALLKEFEANLKKYGNRDKAIAITAKNNNVDYKAIENLVNKYVNEEVEDDKKKMKEKNYKVGDKAYIATIDQGRPSFEEVGYVEIIKVNPDGTYDVRYLDDISAGILTGVKPSMLEESKKKMKEITFYGFEALPGNIVKIVSKNYGINDRFKLEALERFLQNNLEQIEQGQDISYRTNKELVTLSELLEIDVRELEDLINNEIDELDESKKLNKNNGLEGLMKNLKEYTLEQKNFILSMDKYIKEASEIEEIEEKIAKFEELKSWCDSDEEYAVSIKKNIQEELDKLNKQFEELAIKGKQTDSLIEEKENLTKNLEEKEKNINELSSTKEDFYEKFDEIKEYTNKLKESYDILNTEYTTLKEKVEKEYSLNENVDQLIEYIEKLEVDSKELQEQIETLNAKNSELQESLNKIAENKKTEEAHLNEMISKSEEKRKQEEIQKQKDLKEAERIKKEQSCNFEQFNEEVVALYKDWSNAEPKIEKYKEQILSCRNIREAQTEYLKIRNKLDEEDYQPHTLQKGRFDHLNVDSPTKENWGYTPLTEDALKEDDNSLHIPDGWE